MALKSNLGKIAAQVDPAIKRGVQRSGAMVVDLARQLVPKDTTSLMRTIRNEDGPGPLDVTVIAGDPTAQNIRSGEPVSYAPHVEYGTARSAAQPFFTPAYKAIDVRREVEAEIRAILGR
jgi:HK97 gp10 family phage protein